MIKLGVIGIGFVGNAIVNAYQKTKTKIVKIDIDPDKGTDNYADLESTDAVFVCVPSPSRLDGSCDTSILINTLDKLKDYKGIIIAKTTAPPNVYRALGTVYHNLVHVPEFLTANDSNREYLNETCSIIGCNDVDIHHKILSILKQGQPNIKYCMFCKIEEAAFTKYVINTFLATKVIYMNEMAKLADKFGLDWAKISQLLTKDDRVGLSHITVPGPDNQPGFGGLCFPKDTSAWLQFANSLGIRLTILEQVVKVNKEIRL